MCFLTKKGICAFTNVIDPENDVLIFNIRLDVTDNDTIK